MAGVSPDDSWDTTEGGQRKQVQASKGKAVGLRRVNEYLASLR